MRHDLQKTNRIHQPIHSRSSLSCSQHSAWPRFRGVLLAGGGTQVGKKEVKTNRKNITNYNKPHQRSLLQQILIRALDIPDIGMYLPKKSLLWQQNVCSVPWFSATKTSMLSSLCRLAQFHVSGAGSKVQSTQTPQENHQPKLRFCEKNKLRFLERNAKIYHL